MTQLTSWVHRYTLRDLLDDSFDLFKERVITLLVVGAFPYILVVAYMALMRFYVFPGNFMHNFSDFPDLLNNPSFWIYISGLLFVSMVAFAVSLAAQSQVAIAHALGEEVSVRTAYRRVFLSSLRLFVISIIYSIFLFVVMIIALIIVGMIIGLVGMVVASLVGVASGTPESAFVIAAISVVVSYAVMMMAMVLVNILFLTAPMFVVHERCGAFTALSRSFNYAMVSFKANVVALWALLHLPLIFTILASGLAALLIFGLQTVAPTVGDVAGGTITMLVSSLSFSAVIACQSALAYIDGKCRLEALDLRVMAQDMGLQEEIEQAFRTTTTPGMPRNYPQYAARQQTPGMAMPNYQAPPRPGQTASPFPNYAAPPPSLPPQYAPALPPDTPSEPPAPAVPEDLADPHAVPASAATSPSTPEVADAE